MPNSNRCGWVRRRRTLPPYFRTAREEEAVLFFDEADAIAARRSTSVHYGFQRESNSVVSVLLTGTRNVQRRSDLRHKSRGELRSGFRATHPDTRPLRNARGDGTREDL